MALYDPKNDPYFCAEWAQRRSSEAEWHELFTGEAIRDAELDIIGTDNKKEPKYPLGINPFRQFAEIHRDVLIGELPNTDEMPIKVSVDKRDDLTEIVTKIFEDSDGTSIFPEMGIMMQVRGGHAFKVSWEPWNENLRYRIRLVPIESAWLWPTWNRTDYWNLTQAYIGYEMDADQAEEYGVKIEKGRESVVYLEDWRPDSYKITIDGKEPASTFRGRPAKWSGSHDFGKVPIWYIPHERVGDFWGLSHIPDLKGMAFEANLRAADLGDAVWNITHQLPWTRNTRNKGGVKVVPVYDAQTGSFMTKVFDLGDQPAGVQNAPVPEMDYPKQANIPPIVTEFDEMLWGSMRNQTRTSDVAMGAMPIGSGRVVGTVMSTMMWPTTSHVQNERLSVSTGMKYIVRMMLKMLKVYRPQLKALGIDVPEVSDDTLKARIMTKFYPAIPVEKTSLYQMQDAAFTAGTVDLQTILEERGVRNIPETMARIWADAKKKAEIAAAAQVKIAEMELEAEEANREQELKQAEELHKQKMRFAEEDHALGQQHKQEQHEVRVKQQKSAAANPSGGK